MIEDEESYIINYVLKNFRYLMNIAEIQALDAIVIYEGNGEEFEICVRGGNSLLEAKELLKNGERAFRKTLVERLLSEHRVAIYANSCPNCGKLPRTAKAKQCPWCYHSWHKET